MSEWHNHGDVNFLEYGGCLVRKISSQDCYEIISLITEIPDYKGKYKCPMIVARCYIDLDAWLEAKNEMVKINEFAGFGRTYIPQTEEEKESYCVDLVNYYGVEEFDPEFPEETDCGPYALGSVDRWIVGKEIVKRFLKEYDVPYEFRH